MNESRLEKYTAMKQYPPKTFPLVSLNSNVYSTYYFYFLYMYTRVRKSCKLLSILRLTNIHILK